MPDTTSPLDRLDGVTDAERYLTRLARQSFLSLWSYPGIYRDQGDVVRGGDGKEVCDLLVVFDNHLIIFSDKDCAFPNTGDLDLDWSRWFRRAVAKSAQQIRTGERWIRRYPDRLFLDRKCQQPFPIDVPPPDTMKVHRILVAHGASERCREEIGGSGSLIIRPNIIGERHLLPRTDGGLPFATGQVDTEEGYCHVFDDTTLDIVLNTLDTVTDFVEYLEKKEQFIASGRLGGAEGEEELLGLYLSNVNAQEKHDFIVPAGEERVWIHAGFWHDFENSPQRKAQLEADKVSYFWDRLIEHFLSHTYAGTCDYVSHPGLANQEPVFRLLAAERRTWRRALSEGFIEFVRNTPSRGRARRIVGPAEAGGPYYVFLLIPEPGNVPYEEYRDIRRKHLEECCMITKAELPEAFDIIGIATESGRGVRGSEDVAYLDARQWTQEQQSYAEGRRAELISLGVMGQQRRSVTHVSEYPDVPTPLHSTQNQVSNTIMKGNDRNKKCPCGSGRKRKQCCG